jgi:thiol-disulfide isomerase/thioredoxin
MKQIFIVIALSILFLAGCNSKKATVITGVATGKSDLKFLEYTVPLLSGTSYIGFSDTVRLDENGNFELKFNIDKPVFITIWNKDPYCSALLLVEPENSYHLAMDISKQDAQISNANAEKQLYVTLWDFSYVESDMHKFKLTKDTSLTSIHNRIKELKRFEISNLEQLLSHNEISESFFNTLIIDRDCYYAALEAVTYLAKLSRLFNKNPVAQPETEDLLKCLAEIYEQYPPNDERLFVSPFWEQLADSYITWYKLYEQGHYDMEKFKQELIEQQSSILIFDIAESKKYLKGKELEFFQATFLFQNAYQAHHEKELISLYEQFTKDYPDSEYSKYIKPYIDEIISYYQIIEKPFAENVRFMDNYENIKTLDEALIPLKGKKIYIDVWATWCTPCKKEFVHLNELKKILDEQDVQQLFISIDEDNRDEKWKNGIKFYGLEGTHIRANKDLAMDLYKRYDRKAKTPYMSIPWYIMVDENGNIVNEHAEEPSKIVVNGLSFK